MRPPLDQHQTEIERNLALWENKPLIREIYAGFYREIVQRLALSVRGEVVELGSGIGNLRTHYPSAICSDLFANPWLDLACDAYHLPFRDGAVSNLVLFDVFHHLERPFAFLSGAARVLAPGGRLILFEPYLSLASWPAYGIFHHEPVAWRETISCETVPPEEHRYYAAQGNATRLFFGRQRACLPKGWRVLDRKVFASFTYLLSGGLSKPALYPARARGLLERLERFLAAAPGVFGSRCLVVLQPER
jgi:SAM-dependent methyltransferase